MSKISTVNLNEPTAAPSDAQDPTPVAMAAPAAVEAPGHEAADDIDTDELESLLTDLKKTKKLNKAPSKPRVRKPKAKAVVDPEEAPVVLEPVAVEPAVAVAEPVVADPVVDEVKSKRKYTRKANKIPETVPEPLDSATPCHVEEPVKRSPGNLIEEMQRAERALRYQMRKNKMQTLVSQAF